jgi:20S proteasome alpha/beta subunit
MTLVLGGRCRDGVVIVTDMKITSLASGSPVFLKYETKISGVFSNIIFGYAGDVDTYEVYLNYAIGDAVRKRDDPIDAYTNDNFIQKLGDNMAKIQRIIARNQRDCFCAL